MILIRDPKQHGFVPHLLRIYREKRRDQAPHHPGLTMRMSRRAALSLAWHQARQARL